MRISNGCSTSAPRCSAAKQWLEGTGSKAEEEPSRFVTMAAGEGEDYFGKIFAP